METHKRNNEFVFPCRTGRNLARVAAIIHRCVQSGEWLQTIISRETFRRRRRSPRSKYRSWSSLTSKQQMKKKDNADSRKNQKLSTTQKQPCCEESERHAHTFLYMYRNHVAPRRKIIVPKDDFPIPLNYIHVQRHTRKRTLTYFMRQLSTILGNWWRQSHCLIPGSVWQNSNCSTKIHPKAYVGFKVD